MKDIFAIRLRKCLKDAALTQIQAATYCNLAKTTYQSYELGIHRPRLASLAEIAQFYGGSIDYLLGRVDDPKPYPKSVK